MTHAFGNVVREWMEAYGESPCQFVQIGPHMMTFAEKLDLVWFYEKTYSAERGKPDMTPEILDYVIECLDQLKCEAKRLRGD